MKFKLDENLGKRIQRIFQKEGLKYSTVLEQNLKSCSDNNLYKICLKEKPCLVTLDRDFTDIIRFPPTKTEGIVIFRVPQNLNFPILERLTKEFCGSLKHISPKGQTWIVEIGRTRIHEPS